MIRAACGRHTSTAESRYNNICYWKLSAPKLNFGRIYNGERDETFDNLSNIVRMLDRFVFLCIIIMGNDFYLKELLLVRSFVSLRNEIRILE